MVIDYHSGEVGPMGDGKKSETGELTFFLSSR